jgi:hypothetical protein
MTKSRTAIKAMAICNFLCYLCANNDVAESKVSKRERLLRLSLIRNRE